MKAHNGKGNDDQDGNDLSEKDWILPFIMLGSRFSSLMVAWFSLNGRNQAPFGPALGGAIMGKR